MKNSDSDAVNPGMKLASQTGFFSNLRAAHTHSGRQMKPAPKYVARKIASQRSGLSGCSTYLVKYGIIRPGMAPVIDPVR